MTINSQKARGVYTLRSRHFYLSIYKILKEWTSKNL